MKILICKLSKIVQDNHFNFYILYVHLKFLKWGHVHIFCVIGRLQPPAPLSRMLTVCCSLCLRFCQILTYSIFFLLFMYAYIILKCNSDLFRNLLLEALTSYIYKEVSDTAPFWRKKQIPEDRLHSKIKICSKLLTALYWVCNVVR